MSSICIVCIEGVLTETGDALPTAFIKPTPLLLVQQIAGRWPIGYISAAPREVVVEWLKDSGAPTAVWVAQSDSSQRGAMMLRMLAERRDRPAMVFVPDPAAFGSVAAAGAIVVTVTHPADYGLGDWKQPSSWDGSGGQEVKHG